MKASRILLLCSAFALPQLAMAGLADTSPQGLGIVKAYLTYCTEVDPRNVASFQTEWKSIVGDASTQQLGVAESGTEFKKAFDSTIAELKKQSKSAVADACATGAVQWKDGKTPGKGRDDITTVKHRDQVSTDKHSDGQPSMKSKY